MSLANGRDRRLPRGFACADTLRQVAQNPPGAALIGFLPRHDPADQRSGYGWVSYHRAAHGGAIPSGDQTLAMESNTECVDQDQRLQCWRLVHRRGAAGCLAG